MNGDARIRSADGNSVCETGNAEADKSGKPRMPSWMERLLRSHAPSLPLHRHRWFARDLDQFLAYGRSRGHDKLDVELLASEYLESLRHSEPTVETWKIEQARQALDVFVRGVDGWRWERDSERGEWARDFAFAHQFRPQILTDGTRILILQRTTRLS